MILDEIVADKKKRLTEYKQKTGVEAMKQMALACDRRTISFYEAMKKPGLSIIGEFKKASPSMGKIPGKLDLADRIKQYNGAVEAISCLTEEDHFNGSTDYLKQIRAMSPLPILRKDFIIDAYQIYEAKLIGADAILLIAAILDDRMLKQFMKLAKSLGLDVLLEVHDEEEMSRAVSLGAPVIGINNRNLKDFTISLETTKRLSAMADPETVLISESGMTTAEDIRYLKQCRVDGLLIGRAFMEAEEPGRLAGEWKEIFW